MIHIWIIITLTQLLHLSFGFDEKFLGCYDNRSSSKIYKFSQHIILEQCIHGCYQKYYRFSLITSQQLCYCSNHLGQQLNTTLCNDHCAAVDCDRGANLTDSYATGNLVPAPPKTLQVLNITEESVQIFWELPESFVDITSYQVKLIAIPPHSSFVISPIIWTYSNDTFRAEIRSLVPFTKYNITVSAISLDGVGGEAWTVIQTKIGDPDNLPDSPILINRNKSNMEIKISPTVNNNGPISSYLVVVVNKGANQIFQQEFLKSYNEAKMDGISYYITAELDPEAIEQRNFIVGDGNFYKRYYNAPLNPNAHYEVIIGMKSELNGIVKTVYSQPENSYKQLIFDVDNSQENRGDSPAIVIGLSIAIGLLSFMFVAGIIGFIILKSRVTTRRQRLSDNQELTLQGPMIEVENNGYIPEEEPTKANHYKNLKEKLRAIPYTNLKLEPTNLLGVGRFGRVNLGSVFENDTFIPAAIYTITDKKLNNEDKKAMLKDLDVLIRTGKHEYIRRLIGTCETSQVLFVLLEYFSMNLKDFLLGSRETLPGRFSNMSENQALNIAIGICRGMAHLENNKIVHKQLCARSILLANGNIPKISGYGLAQYYSYNNLPDFTRWIALEVFKGQEYNSKSDVWSFGCLLWEICVLGGTPYGNYSNNEVPQKVIQGLRLPQMQYFSDDLFNVMLNCWQIDMDERPNFFNFIDILENLKKNTLIPYLNFNLYSSFQYEQFYPDMEIAVRPVF